MTLLSNLSIRRKLTLVTLVTTSVALLIACAAFVVHDQLALRTSLLQDYSVRARMVVEHAQVALQLNDPLALDHELEALATDPHVQQVIVYDAAGREFARYTAPEHALPAPPVATVESAEFVGGHLEVAQEVRIRGASAGWVFLRTDLGMLRERRDRNALVTLLVLMGAAGVVYLFASRMQRWVTRPILELAAVAKRVAVDKDFSVRAPKAGEDEIGRLNQAFNEMLAQIQVRDEALVRATLQLELRVEERTSEVTEANNRLQTELDANVRARQESDQLRAKLETAYDCLQREVAQRAGAQEALRRSEERFSKAFRSSPVPLAILTRKAGEFVDVNDAFGEFVGAHREAVIGQSLFALPLCANPALGQRLQDVLKNGEVLRHWECRFQNRAGAPQVALLSTETLRLGTEACVLLMVEDATSRVNLESQLRQAQKMDAIGQLASGVAHDFNNLLTVIQGHTQLVLSTHAISAKTRDSLTKVATAGQRASQLTRQLLTFSRKQFVQLVPTDLNQVVANVRLMLEPLLGEAVKLRWTPSVDLPLIEADAGMVEQVIVNLAVNARDAMTAGGELTISTWHGEFDAEQARAHPQGHAGKFVCLTVRDTGCGIDPQTMEHIFEPFFTTKGVGKGTGLGLATAYGIVKQHQGWIEVASEPNVGTTFRIFFPQTSAVTTGAPDNAVDPDATTVGGGKETILVVEDEPALRELVSHILRDLGYDVLEAVHGKEALKVWEARPRPVDLLLTDMMMPEGISGSDLATRLREQAPELKVVYTSGYSPELVGRDLQLQPGLNFLPKPYNPRTLARTVRECLDRN
jgi:two-component system cell cycle sensor histidine kinase/response regulator CckA